MSVQLGPDAIADASALSPLCAFILVCCGCGVGVGVGGRFLCHCVDFLHVLQMMAEQIILEFGTVKFTLLHHCKSSDVFGDVLEVTAAATCN